MNNKYICLFKENGERYTTILKGIHFKDDAGKEAFINRLKEEASKQGIDTLIEKEVTAEQFNTLLNNNGYGDNGTGYIWDFEKNEPVSSPPREITLEMKLNTLKGTYSSQVSEVDEMISIAQKNNDTDYIEELQNERKEIIEKYGKELEEYL